MKSVILMGADIEDNVIIGAGSVVSGRVESNSVYAGVPARKVCTLQEYEEKLKNGFVRSSATWADALRKKNGRFPDPSELIMYSTVLEGHETDIGGRNVEILKNIPKYKTVEELIGILKR